MATNTYVYEAMFIFDANRFARDRTGLPSEIEEMIKAGGGEVLVSRLWEERRLAYPINGQRKGTYWLYYFKAPGSAIDPLERQCGIHDSILRQLILRIHPHLVDAVLEHARHDPEQAAKADGPGEPAVAAGDDKKDKK